MLIKGLKIMNHDEVCIYYNLVFFFEKIIVNNIIFPDFSTMISIFD